MRKVGGRGRKRGTAITTPPSLEQQTGGRLQKAQKTSTIGSSGAFTYKTEMHFKPWLILSVCLLLPVSEAERQMPKLSDKKLCADSECSCK